MESKYADRELRLALLRRVRAALAERLESYFEALRSEVPLRFQALIATEGDATEMRTSSSLRGP